MHTIEVDQTPLGKKTVIQFEVNFAYINLNPLNNIEQRLLNNTELYFNVPLIVDLKNHSTRRILNIDQRKKFYKRVANDCGIHNNSKKNPALMSTSKKGVYAIDGTSYISILEYQNSNNAVFTFIRNGMRWVGGKKPHTFYQSSDIYSITIRNDGKTSLTKNNKLCLSRIDIENALEVIYDIVYPRDTSKLPVYKMVSDLFFKYFFYEHEASKEELKKLNLENFGALYLIQRNRKLYQLPWSIFDLAKIYSYNTAVSKFNQNKSIVSARRSINRYLRLGETKKATDACFFGYEFPKSIRKILLKLPPLYLKKESCHLIYQAIQDYSVDHIRTIITTPAGEPNIQMIKLGFFRDLLDLGFSVKRIVNADIQYLEDIITMRSRLATFDIAVEFSPSLNVYHKRLQEANQNLTETLRQQSHDDFAERLALNRYKEQKLEETYAKTDTSRLRSPCYVDKFLIRSPTTPLELKDVGKHLNICVESYMTPFFLEKNEIVLLTKNINSNKEKYIACLEIKRDKLVQAKLNSNRPVVLERSIFKVVDLWLKNQGVISFTSDMGVNDCNYIESQAPNKERLEKYEKIKKLTSLPK